MRWPTPTEAAAKNALGRPRGIDQGLRRGDPPRSEKGGGLRQPGRGRELARPARGSDQGLRQSDRDQSGKFGGLLQSSRGQALARPARGSDQGLRQSDRDQSEKCGGLRQLARGATKNSLGRHGEAIKDWGEAIRLNSQNAEAHYYRGEAHKALGQTEKARDNFQRALALATQQGNELLAQMARDALDSCHRPPKGSPPSQPWPVHPAIWIQATAPRGCAAFDRPERHDSPWCAALPKDSFQNAPGMSGAASGEVPASPAGHSRLRRIAPRVRPMAYCPRLVARQWLRSGASSSGNLRLCMTRLAATGKSQGIVWDGQEPVSDGPVTLRTPPGACGR